MPSNKSEVWKHYTNEGKNARCIRCGTLIHRAGNTTNMWSHLRTKHNIQNLKTQKKNADPVVRGAEDSDTTVDDPAPIDEVMVIAGSSNEFKSPTTSCQSAAATASANQDKNKSSTNMKSVAVTGAFARQSSFKEGGDKDRAITEALVYMIVKDSLPCMTPEKDGFKKFVNVCVPLWKGISRRTVSRLIDAKYELISSRLKKDVIPSMKYICLTCDIWTDVQRTKSYLGITAHYLKEDFMTMETVMLDVVPLEDRHTAVNLAAEFQSVSEKWGINKEQITAIVTDNASNMKLAVEMFLGPNRHVSCMAHTLNLIPTEALKNVTEIQVVKDKVKSIVTFFKRSVVAADALRQSQERSDCGNEPLKLKQEVATRFYSTYIMLERFDALKDHIASALIKVPGGPDMITGAEQAVLKEVIAFLHPFQQAITELSAEKTVTCSKVIPLIHCITKTMEDTKASSPPVQLVKVNLLSSLHRRFDTIERNDLYALSTLMDPRFKRMHFTDAAAHASVITKVSELVKESQSKRSQEVAKELESSSKKTSGSFWSLHNSLLATAAALGADSILEDVPVELQQYLSQLPHGLENDPFKVWRTLKETFSDTYSIAVKYLPIPATSVPCERLFSKTGRLVNNDRNRLSPKNIGKLCFLNSIPHERWNL